VRVERVDPLRVGVVGVGHLGREHARIYASLPEVELVGVSDRDASRASTVAGHVGARAFTAHSELLAEVDAVSIAVPTVDHYALAKEALLAGTHVLVEKPITKTVEEADELVRLAEAHGLSLQVGHIERYNPAIQAIIERIERPLFIECHRLSPFGNRGTDVSVVLDVMIHDVDIVLGLVKSRVRRIDAVGIPVLSSQEDIANARLEFEGGCIANLTASRVSAEKLRKIRIFQRDSYISVDYVNQEVKEYRRVEGEAGVTIIPEDVQVVSEEPLRAELISFIDAIREGRRPLVSGVDGRRALEVAQWIVREVRQRGQAMIDELSRRGEERQIPQVDSEYVAGSPG
jgi:predicted dehydrogenase